MISDNLGNVISKSAAAVGGTKPRKVAGKQERHKVFSQRIKTSKESKNASSVEDNHAHNECNGDALLIKISSTQSRIQEGHW